MSKLHRLGQLGLMVAGAGIAIVAYEAGRARAGVPATQALVYSGFLTDDTGAPITGERNIAVDLYGSSDPSDDVLLCDTVSQKINLTLTGGYFSLVLQDECSAKVQEDLIEPWVEVRVDGNPMPRTKIAAVPYALQAAKLTSAGIDEIKAQIKQDLKTELATPEIAYPPCPPGYTKMGDDKIAWADFTICFKGDEAAPYDQVVKVGTGSSAFWVDRYEATLWTANDGSGSALGGPPANYPLNGEIDTTVLYALSSKLGGPTSDLTWFQAEEACTASGKRLPTGEEWLRAERGTYDPPVANPGAGKDPWFNALCNTLSNGPRSPGYALGNDRTTSCVSDWGAEDMIGNFGEWTEEWHFSAGVTGAGSYVDQYFNLPWPAGFHDDHTVGVSSSVGYALEANGTKFADHMPAVAYRGGYYGYGTDLGRYYIDVENGPVLHWVGIGFRCVVSR